MKIILKNGSKVPLFEQVKEAMKENIMVGNLKDGEQVPSVRALAKELKISILTVKKAYDELAQEGFIEIRQGLGTFVAETNQELKREEKQKKLEGLLEEVAMLARQLGLEKEELFELMQFIAEGDCDGK